MPEISQAHVHGGLFRLILYAYFMNQ